MKQRIIAGFTAFIIFTSLIFNTSLTVYASSTHGGGGVSHDDLKGWDNWTLSEKGSWWISQLPSFLGGVAGLYVNGSGYELYETCLRFYYDLNKRDEESFEEYLGRNLGYDTETQEVSVSDELMDSMHNAGEKYINENPDYYLFETADINFDKSTFDSKEEADFYCKAFNTISNDNDAFIFFRYIPSDTIDSTSKEEFVKTLEDGTKIGSFLCSEDFNINDYFYVLSNYSKYSSTSQFAYFNVYDSNWQIVNMREKFPVHIKYTDGTSCLWENYVVTDIFNYGFSWGLKDRYSNKWSIGMMPTNYGHYWNVTELNDLLQDSFITREPVTVRIFTSVDAMKRYSLNQRPYYITDKFQDYDVNGDNSCIISESDLKNGSVYGDVYNYIINNYGDEANGLSEEELIRIISAYLGQSSGNTGGNTGGGTGGGSVSGNNNGGGGGLGGFLDGLGAIGDALLSILGKLMEYIGKAIELLSDTVMNIVEVIPQNITNLISALFPFIPKEWITAIELSLVLSVIIGIVRIFKK